MKCLVCKSGFKEFQVKGAIMSLELALSVLATAIFMFSAREIWRERQSKSKQRSVMVPTTINQVIRGIIKRDSKVLI